MLVTTIHELSHLTTARILGWQATLYPNVVDAHGHIGNFDTELIAGTGPLFSLVTGLLIIWLVKTDNWKSGFARLLVLWFGFLSAETGFGYLFVAPLVAGGDTGQVLALVHAAWWVYAIVFVIGIAGFVLLLPRLFSWRFSGFADSKKEFFQFGMWAWLFGTIALLVIYLLVGVVMATFLPDSPVLFILMGVATIGVFTPIANWSEGLRKANPQVLTLSRPILGIVLSVIVAVLLIAVLARGLNIG